MKRHFITALSLLVCTVFLGQTAFAALDAKPLNFQKHGGGQYIYCNNDEGIGVKDLADDTVANPMLIMQNDDLKVGKYSVFISHLNNTGEQDQNYAIISRGFDIEVDVRFHTKRGAKVRITAMGFDVPRDELATNWSCTQAWADYMQRPVVISGGTTEYTPMQFEPVEFTLGAGEEKWVSEYIKNYYQVPFLMPVHMVFDMEVLEGTVNADVAALRHTGTLGDRSHFAKNSKRGIYYRDRQYKGVADTLPQVEVKLDYQADDQTPFDTALPMFITNQYVPKGNAMDEWVTNINPHEDVYTRKNAAESDMLAFSFYDGTKEGYYAPSIPESERDKVWRFDVFHSDTIDGGNPNYELSASQDNAGVACNLGNYGVRTRYNITATNTGTQTRYFSYFMQTTSNNIITVYDASGVPLTPYSICKGASDGTTSQKVAAVEVAPGETKNFIIESILTTNDPGGMRNRFEWTQQGMPAQAFSGTMYRPAPEKPVKNQWVDKKLDGFAKQLLEGNWDNYEIKQEGDRYFMRWQAYDGAYNYYWRARPFMCSTFVFDKNLKLLAAKQFPNFPESIDIAKGVFYTKAAGKDLRSRDGIKWENTDAQRPIYNGGVCAVKGGADGISVSRDGWFFYKVKYQNGQMPTMAGVKNGKYQLFDASANPLGVSPDGVYFVPEDEVNPAKNVIVSLEDTVLGFDSPPIIKDGATLVPIRLLFETLGATVGWSEETRTASINYEGKLIEVQVDNDVVWVDGQERKIDVAAVQENGRTLIPLRFLMEEFGFQVDWDGANSWVAITGVK